MKSSNKKYLILGVAHGWDKRKGIDVFIKLSEIMGDEYQIVLVGTDPKVEEMLPDNIISIRRTNNRTELAEIYTAADVFVNPTREENYPTVNMEAIACGTPVVTFNTGGSPEMLDAQIDEIVPCDDISALERAIRKICRERKCQRQFCVNRACSFDRNVKYKEYVALYESSIKQ